MVKGDESLQMRYQYAELIQAAKFMKFAARKMVWEVLYIVTRPTRLGLTMETKCYL